MIETLSKAKAASRMNALGAAREPFLFAIDFELRRPIVLPLSAVDAAALRYDLNGQRNCPPAAAMPQDFFFEKYPLSRELYHEAFQQVQENLRAGNSYLLNLTFPTAIATDLSLEEIFRRSQARYRLWLQGQFACFSPESFVTIRAGQIASFPMKGTIDASLPQAEALLLGNAKESAEHATIVDLIRNDLSMVAQRVRVRRYRYVEEIATHQGSLLQSSSEIVGELPGDYRAQLGDILFRLLPAGSICGAPKAKTVDIIQAAEGGPRGYYTGVCGLFDGETLDSGVMIRFIEQQGASLVFRSGGGITAQSAEAEEYAELTRKVYLPFAAAAETLAQPSAGKLLIP
jgi:para-aminobenzoate synthetase component 1